MKTISIALLTFLLVFSVTISESFGQTKEEKKQAKEEKKKQKEVKELAGWNEAKALAASQKFVFESNQAFSNDGSFGLDPKTNFFYIIGDEAVIQFALNGVVVGGNGVGGITIKGHVEKYEIKADKQNKPITVNIQIKPTSTGTTGIWNLTVTFYNEGYGELSVSSQGFRLNGSILTPERSNVYQGASF